MKYGYVCWALHPTDSTLKEFNIDLYTDDDAIRAKKPRLARLQGTFAKADAVKLCRTIDSQYGRSGGTGILVFDIEGGILEEMQG